MVKTKFPAVAVFPVINFDLQPKISRCEFSARGGKTKRTNHYLNTVRNGQDQLIFFIIVPRE